MPMASALLLLVAANAGTAGKRPDRGTLDLEPIDRVWSGHAVRFALEVGASVIFIAYYDAQRQLTVASRPRDGRTWSYQKLDTATPASRVAG
jgi:hypothetical protein